jgi:protocatechuate 3,4-dioxygenase beta subunit/uncharacterized protein (DUF2141 family)
MRNLTRMRLFSPVSLGVCLWAFAVLCPSLRARQGTATNQWHVVVDAQDDTFGQQENSTVSAQSAPNSQSNELGVSTADSSARASIAGTVLSAATGDPLKKARITLSLSGDRGDAKPLSTITDEAGHFSIDQIPPGRYLLDADRNGYLRQQYGQTKADRPGVILTLSAGQKMGDISFRLQRSAVITGRVVDEDGDPIPGAQVQAMRRTYVRGKPVFSANEEGRTDDRGEYRIYGLEPGNYYVLATDQRNFVLMGGEDNAPEYAPVYFPNAASADHASAVTVAPGDEIPGIDFTLVSNTNHGFEISGKVLGLTQSVLRMTTQVMLSPTGDDSDDPMRREMRSTILNQKDNSFTFTHVQAGNYLLSVLDMRSGNEDSREFASQQITVSDSDISGIELSLHAGVDVTGHVTVEGHTTASAMGAMIAIFPKQGSVGFDSRMPTAVQSDGSFTVKGLADGDYMIGIWSNCHTCYLKAATTKDGADVLTNGLEITGGSAPPSIELIYSSNTAQVSGTVTQDDEKPAQGATVILVPDMGTPNRDERFQTATTDQYGHFEIAGIPPGRFSVLALSDFDDSSTSFTDPDFLRAFGERPQSIDLAEGDRQTLQLNVIAPADDNQ